MIDSGTSKFDLTLYVMEEPQGLTFICEYNTDLFNSDRIERMLGHLQVLLEGVVADPDRRLVGLPLLTSEERHRLLIEWNDTQVVYPGERLIHELFEAQGRRTPRRCRRGVRQATSSPTGNWSSEQISWRIICERWEWGRMCWSGSAWSARWRWWWGCWGF